jgi:hypothetical protein
VKNVHPSLVALVALLALLPGLVFTGLRLELPGDASNPIVDLGRMNSGQLVVQPLSPDPQGLQNGDIVTAIQGRAVDEYITGLFSARPPAGLAGRIEYTVLRAGRDLQLEVPRVAFPILPLIEESWSVYLYLVYLELVSLFLFILRPRLPVAQLFFVVSSVHFSSTLIYFSGLKVDDLLYPWLVIFYLWGAVALYGIMLAGLVHLALIFPGRHPLLEKQPKWVLWIYSWVWLAASGYVAARWGATLSPVGRLALVIQATSWMSIFYLPLVLLAATSSYRAGNAGEKRQARWVMWSLMISLVPYLIFSVAPALLGFGFNVRLANSWLGLLWCTVPTSFAIAVLRERLFDIDLIIHRTLVYSVLTTALVIIYFGSVVLLQNLFRLLIGQSDQLAIVASTLAIAATFTPLRRRVQDVVDRRFYRRKYNAEQVLASFSDILRAEVDLNQISAELLGVVQETMQPEEVSLWLPKSDIKRLPG